MLPRSDTSPLVLVVDDEELVRVVAVQLLEEDGFRVLEASDVREAVELLERERVDLVFSDIQMPGGLDGCDLARWVSVNRPGLPVILASGCILDDSLPGDLRSIAPIIRKSYRGDLLMQRVAAALQHQANSRYPASLLAFISARPSLKPPNHAARSSPSVQS